jgi:hypothetical protein
VLLGCLDGELDRADPAEAVGRIAARLWRVRLQVVVTFDPFGAHGVSLQDEPAPEIRPWGYWLEIDGARVWTDDPGLG